MVLVSFVCECLKKFFNIDKNDFLIILILICIDNLYFLINFNFFFNLSFINYIKIKMVYIENKYIFYLYKEM